MKTRFLRVLRRALLLLAALIGLGATLVAAGCLAPPGPKASAEQIATLDRFVYTAPSGEVSALRGGTAGERPLSVFVHGTPGTGVGWADYLLNVPGGGEGVALDRPGFGASEPAGSLPALVDQAAAILPLLGTVGGPGTVLVGHSLGAPIAAWVAAEHPQRVAGLVLIAGSMDPALERRRWFNSLAAWSEPLIGRNLRNSNQEVWGFKEQLEALAPLLERITCPVLILHGERDGLVPAANADYSEAMLVSAERVQAVRYPEAGHLLIWGQPTQDEVWAELERFVLSL